MTSADDRATILVVGGGPAGVSAAVALARSGARVVLAEQRNKLGGALHRQAASLDAHKVLRASGHVAAWNGLMAELASVRQRITIAASTIFSGIDGSGYALLDNRRTGELLAFRPAGIVLALGATEVVHPFQGWELPGVISAGGAQVLLKETGRTLPGTTLLAGSGPLLLSLGAQLCAAGTPPVAIYERGNPSSHPSLMLDMLRTPRQVLEGTHYALGILRARVPYRMGAEILSAARYSGRLAVEVRTGNTISSMVVDNLVVHDGIRAGHMSADLSGLPFPVVEAGDGREVLGGHCAPADGRVAAATLLKKLGRTASPSAADIRTIDRARRFQRSLSGMFYSKPPEILPDTVLCRCEGRRAASLMSGISPREAKLVGRFGMGACQGRFCAAATARMLGGYAAASDFRPAILRWPLRPISAEALSRLTVVSSNIEKILHDDNTIA